MRFSRQRPRRRLTPYRRWLTAGWVAATLIMVADPAAVASVQHPGPPSYDNRQPAHSSSLSGEQPKSPLLLTDGNSPFADELDLLAGSPQSVLYTTRQAWQRGPTGPAALLATTNGTTVSLALPSGISPDDFENFSIVDQVAVGFDGDATVYWWDLASGEHGHTKLPGHNSVFLGGAPGGFVYATSNGNVMDQPTNGGSATDLGSPFGDQSSVAPASGFSTSSALAVLSTGSTLSYLPWADPSFNSLVAPTGVRIEACTSIITNTAVGCSGTEGDYQHSVVIRVPTNGDAPTVVQTASSDPDPTAVSLTNSSTVWTDPVSGKLYSTPVDGSSTTDAKGARLPPEDGQYSTSVSADNQVAVIEGSPRRARIALTDAAGQKAQTLLVAADAPLHASSVALNQKTVDYTDNSSDYDAGDVMARSIAGAASVRTGQAKLVLRNTSASEGLSAGGRHAVDTIETNSTSSSSRVLVNGAVLRGSDGEASGRFVYLSHHGRATIYDVSTGHSLVEPVGKIMAGCVADGRFFYVAKDGSVWLKSVLASGPGHRIATGLSTGQQREFYAADISADGKDVAWSVLVGSRTTVRDMPATRGATVTTIGAGIHLDAATDDGALYYRTSISSSGVTVSWSLRPFGSSRSRQVLVQHYSFIDYGEMFAILTSPQVAVDHGRIAWVDPTGQAYVAALPGQ